MRIIDGPVAVAEACNIEKDEKMEWLVEVKDTYVLKRVNPSKPILKKTK